nr:twin-arginine translocase TatA/TatE family subunit [Actinomyces bowdenii]
MRLQPPAAVGCAPPHRRAREPRGPDPYTERVFGISGSEFLVIMLVAVVVVGPQRLPEYTRQLTRMVRQLRLFLDSARSQIAEEVGPELADLDLSSLDPRQYDPRRIVRDALGEDIEAIRKDLTQPFRSVADAAKETSDAAAKAVGDAVAQDRDNSLGKQISQKRAEALKAAGSTADAEPTADSAAEAAVGSADSASEPEPAAEAEPTASPESAVEPEPAAEPEPARAPGAEAEPAETAGTTEPVEPAESPEPAPSAPEAEAVLDAADEPSSVMDQPEAGAEPAAGDNGAEQDGSGADEGRDEAHDAPVQEAGAQEDAASAPVPSSLVEPGAQSAEAGDGAAERGGPGPGIVRPLSPRDIVRAANSAARTRAEAASATIEP